MTSGDAPPIVVNSGLYTQIANKGEIKQPDDGYLAVWEQKTGCGTDRKIYRQSNHQKLEIICLCFVGQ